MQGVRFNFTICLSNTKNSRPDKISDFLIIEWDIGGVNMRNHGQYLIMINMFQSITVKELGTHSLSASWAKAFIL